AVVVGVERASLRIVALPSDDADATRALVTHAACVRTLVWVTDHDDAGDDLRQQLGGVPRGHGALRVADEDELRQDGATGRADEVLLHKMHGGLGSARGRIDELGALVRRCGRDRARLENRRDRLVAERLVSTRGSDGHDGDAVGLEALVVRVRELSEQPGEGRPLPAVRHEVCAVARVGLACVLDDARGEVVLATAAEGERDERRTAPGDRLLECARTVDRKDREHRRDADDDHDDERQDPEQELSAHDIPLRGTVNHDHYADITKPLRRAEGVWGISGDALALHPSWPYPGPMLTK